MIELWQLFVVISLLFSIPVLAFSYYNVLLFASALLYPKSLCTFENPKAPPYLGRYPKVSILIAVYNEKDVIGTTLDAIKTLVYPRDRLQVIVADDSTDDTRSIIDKKVLELNCQGIESIVSRRSVRENYKAGALNEASKFLKGEFVLLLDADSRVLPSTIMRGVSILEEGDVQFVSYRVGHYNRYSSIVTRLFALSLDMGDTITKMGAYRINAPYTFQGGFTMISAHALHEVGYWSNDTVTEDAEISCKLYCKGLRGVYLSNERIYSEDPPTLEVWKKQTARVSQGWGTCIVKYWRQILFKRKKKQLSPLRGVALLFALLAPFSSLSWIVVNFVSAVGVVFRIQAPVTSIFSNPIYIAIVTIPTVVYFASAGYALRVQSLLNFENLIALPLLSYVGVCMLTASSVGFVNGLGGRTGYFFRTPKLGSAQKNASTGYLQEIRLDKTAALEMGFSIVGLVLSTFVFLDGVWVLGLSMLGFSALTLISLNLQERLSQVRERNAEERSIRVAEKLQETPSRLKHSS